MITKDNIILNYYKPFKQAHRIADQLKKEKGKEPYYYDQVEKPNTFIDKKLMLRNFGRRTFIAYLIATQFLFLRPDLPQCKTFSKLYMDNFFEQEDVTIDSLKEKINSSKYLNKDEKDVLFNEDFFEDILPLVNKSNYSKAILKHRFTNINIKSYDGSNRGDKGYYEELCYNTLNVADYSPEKIKELLDIISHEFIHMCQEFYEYPVLSEASAEILSFEYFHCPIYAYTQEVFLVRKLMETIGSYPVLEYVINGNFKLIEENVKPYLTDRQYSTFLKCLKKTSPYLNENEKGNLNILDFMIDLIYRNKYNEEPYSNEGIKSLSAKSSSRYYFNKRKMTQELSYYVMPREVMPLKEAIEKNYIVFYTLLPDNGYLMMTYDEVMEAKNDPSYEYYCFLNIEGNIIFDFDSFYIMDQPHYIEPFNKYEEENKEDITGEKVLVKEL